MIDFSLIEDIVAVPQTKIMSAKVVKNNRADQKLNRDDAIYLISNSTFKHHLSNNRNNIVISIPNVFKPSLLFIDVEGNLVYYNYDSNKIINSEPEYFLADTIFTWTNQEYAQVLFQQYYEYFKHVLVYSTILSNLNPDEIYIIKTPMLNDTKAINSPSSYGILIGNSYYGIHGEKVYLFIKNEHRIRVIEDYNEIENSFYLRLYLWLKNDVELDEFDKHYLKDLLSEYKKLNDKKIMDVKNKIDLANLKFNIAEDSISYKFNLIEYQLIHKLLKLYPQKFND